MAIPHEFVDNIKGSKFPGLEMQMMGGDHAFRAFKHRAYERMSGTMKCVSNKGTNICEYMLIGESDTLTVLP
jgi:hypothetical protein